jgi:hypothetical protein
MKGGFVENNKPRLDIKTLEKKMAKESLEVEKKIALEALNEISASFIEETIMVNGVHYKKIFKEKKTTICRVTVTWKRPVYEGSKKGETVYYYPADDMLRAPKKTKQSYWHLSTVALLGAFLPYKLVCYIMTVLCYSSISESSVQRYTETVGQFGKENMLEILENRKPLTVLQKDEIFISSIDGSSSMIIGNNKNSTKANSKKRKKSKNASKKPKKSKKNDFLKEAKVFRLSVYNTEKKKIVRTLLIHSTIKHKEEMFSKVKPLFDALEIPKETKIYSIGDGAPWVKDVLLRLHPSVEFLLDFYHLASYVSMVSELKHFTKQKQGQAEGRKYRKKLKKHGGEKVAKSLTNLKKKITGSLDLTQKEIEADISKIDEILSYLEPRLEFTDYPTAQAANRPIGSGFIESACKLIVKQRLCLSGARFNLADAERIMQLRSIIYMEAWDDLVDLMYKKEFIIKHPQPSSSYQPVVARENRKEAA